MSTGLAWIFDLLSLFHLSDTYNGGMRFLAHNAPNPVNYNDAKAECQKQNATLPRFDINEPTTTVGNRFGPLSMLRGMYLHIWLENCIHNGANCWVWAIDVRPGHYSHYKTLSNTATDNIFFVICERGKESTMEKVQESLQHFGAIHIFMNLTLQKFDESIFLNSEYDVLQRYMGSPGLQLWKSILLLY